MQKQEESIQIDAFNTNLHGCKILCQGPFIQGKYAPIMDSIEKLREPFKKKILITKTAFSFSKYLTLQYDAVFQVKDNQDWTLILTYVTYAPKPLLMVVEDVQIPDGLWSKLTKQTTLVNFSSIPIQNVRAYDAIFFAPIEELSSGFAEFIFRQLQSLYRASYSQKEYKEIMQELRVAGAGVAWTRMGEQSMGGNIYWYDPITVSQGDRISPKQLSELFMWLSGHFEKSE
jgi:hypothetical protein